MARTHEPPSVVAVVATLLLRPHRVCVTGWNWKAAICSSVVSASLFAATNAVAGPAAALRAALVELSYRSLASGAFGAATEALSRAEPRWLATVIAMVALPLVGHALEWLVHWMAGTAILGPSIAWSMLLSMLSTLFHLYVMRQGALVVGAGAMPLGHDLRRMPRLIGGFLLEPLRVWSR